MQVEDIKRVAVIGAGMMGLGIGLEFARFGYEVNLYNTKQATSKKAMAQARDNLDLMVETQLLTEEVAKSSYARLHPTIDFMQAVSGADYVIESAPESLRLKQEIFAKLDDICPPSTILATNTSTLRATDIASKAKHPGRILVTHYFGPPHFIPLVEVVKGKSTDAQVVETVAQLLRGLRKKVVVIDIELPLHVGNRIQMAMSSEIHSLVDKGIPPTVVDDIITFGFGRRLPFIGYFQRMDVVGLDGRLERYTAAGQEPWSPIVEHIKRGELGVKSGTGFYDWPPGAVKRLERRLNIELIRLIKQDMDEGLI
ncbi:3-hydroxyacyl-CoA dehydrogenase family protein [Chloroflexota bacterium]